MAKKKDESPVKQYKKYKFLGREIKIETKPIKQFSFAWNWKLMNPFKIIHQPGWELRNDKAKMPWNIYTEGCTIGEHTRTFDIVHTWFKYRGVYLLVSIVSWLYKLFSQPLKNKGYIVNSETINNSQQTHNIPFKVFERAWDLTEDDWIKYYVCRYNAPLSSWSKKKHSHYKNSGCSGLNALRMIKEGVYTLALRDTAYREFFIPLIIRLATEFNKEYSKNPVEHVMYLSKDICDVQYKLASEVLYNNRHGKNYVPITSIPPPMPDMPMFNPNLHEVDGAGNVRFKPEFDMNLKTRELKVNTKDFKVIIAANGQLQIISKFKRPVKNHNPIIHSGVKTNVDEEKLYGKQSEKSKESYGYLRCESGKSKTTNGSVSDGDISGRVRDARQVQQSSVHKKPRSGSVRGSSKVVKK